MKHSLRYQFIDYLMLANSLIIIREIHFFNINNNGLTQGKDSPDLLPPSSQQIGNQR